MTLPDLLHRFNGYHRAGDGYRVKCPGHDDRIPSLSLTEKDAKILLHCHAGCEPQAIVKALGLKMSDLFTEARPREHKAKGEPEAVYQYTDEKGTLLFEVVRFPGKQFRQRRPDGKGGWIKKLDGVRRVLYRLPEILAAKSVLICEGEKDVETARKLGLTANCNPHGAGKWRAEYSEFLAGKRGAVIADADEPGRLHAAHVAGSLFGKVEALKVVELAGAKDLSEWLERGGTRETLLDLIKSVPEWKPARGGDEILDVVFSFVTRFVSLSEAQAGVVALWVAHTHCLEAADCTPYLSVNSAEKQSGKTRLLEVLELLVFEPWLTGRLSSAVLARKIDAKHPTLLLDESDTAFGSEKEYAEALRGLLNTGYRRGGVSSCCVGQGASITYKDFATFCPKAIAGIGKLPDTVADRSIPIRLKRAQRGKVERFRKREVEREAEQIKAKLAAWCAANLEALRESRPEIPSQLSDRQADVSEALLAIADLAGGKWPQEGRRALMELCAIAQAADDSIGVKLLADIRSVFYPRNDDGEPLPRIERVASEDLAKALGEMEDRPWAEWGKSHKAITQPQLARQLSRFDIGPKAMRLPDGRRLKGYEREWFEELWALYLPPDSPLSPSAPDSKSDTVTTRENTGENDDFQSVTADSCHASENAVSASKNAPCHGVTVQKRVDGEKQSEKVEVEWEA
jgi:Protein of unknown function (DUF3631)